MSNIISLFILGVLLHGQCINAQEAQKQASKMEMVMTAHDEVMAEMPKLVKLIGRLETKANNATVRTPFENAISDLKSANKSMMNWMSGFGKRFDADEMMKGKALSEQKQKWLLEEEKKIAALKEEIETSMENAKKLLD